MGPEVNVLKPGRARGLGRPIVTRTGSVLAEITVVPARSKGPAERPWDATGSIEVEQLVIWALRDQMADRHAGVGLHRIEAHAEGLEPQGRTSDGCAALSDIEHMGCRIDRRVGLIRDQVHPAAEAVAVLLSAIEGGDLVRHHGKLAGRPEGWAVPVRWFRPVVWVKHGVLGQAERSGPGNSGMMTRIIQVATWVDIERRRAEYERWHDGLNQLAWLLSMRALGFTVLQPTAPRRPWEATPHA